MSLRILLSVCLVWACTASELGGIATVWAQQAATSPAAPAPALTPAEAQRALQILQDPAQRARLIETLQTIARASGPLPPPEARATEAKPADAKPTAVTLKPDSLAAQLASRLAGWPQRAVADAVASLRTVPDLYLLREWLVRFANDATQREIAFAVAWQLALVLGATLLLEQLTRLALRRPADRLAAHTPDPQEPADGTETDGGSPWHLLRRLPIAAARFGLDLVPIAIFWTAATLLAGLVPVPLTRQAILISVNAYTAIRVTLALGRLLLAPDRGSLRLLHLDDAHAVHLMRWLRRLTLVAVLGGAVAGLALLFGLHPAVYATLIRIVGLGIAIMLAIVVLQVRAPVAAYLRAARQDKPASAWRAWLASVWQYLALVAIAAGWIAWAADFESNADGIWLLLGTIAIIATGRIIALVLTGLLARATEPQPATDATALGLLGGARQRARRWTAVARPVLNIAIAIPTGLLLLEFWGVGAFAWFGSGTIGARILSASATIGVAVVAAVTGWEIANGALERRLARLSEAGTPAHAARLRTLLPMLRAALFVTIAAIVGLTALSEIGINIAPLLAGAGIVGVAIGFGSQKLVQDVVTGLFVLFENAIQVGDSVTVAGLSGKIERLSIRTIWLRGADGALQIVPFSSVGTISNANRGLGIASVSVTIAYGEDSDRAADAMRGIAAEMRQEAEYADKIVEDLLLWVDSVRALGVTLAGTMTCTDAGRWPVQREFNRRLQKRFKELDITLGLKLGDI